MPLNPSRLYMEAVQDAAFSWCTIPGTWASVKDESSYQYESMKSYSHHFWLFQVQYKVSELGGIAAASSGGGSDSFLIPHSFRLTLF